jgi:predicted membrane metal-binding protein
MIFAVVSIIYAGTVLFFVGTAALILLAWARRRYPDRSPSDLIYIAVSIILLVSAGIGMFVASQIVVALGYMG